MICLVIVPFGCTKKISKGNNVLSNSKKDPILITEVIDLKGESVYLKNKKLKFSNTGLIKNGTIEGENIEILAPDIKIFEKVKIAGKWNTKNAKLEWFLGNQFRNASNNFEVIKKYVNVNASIYLNALIPVAMSRPSDFCSKGRNVVIKGNDKKKSGLILESKQSNLLFGYFSSSEGYNLSLRNLSLVSKDYLDGKISESSAEYLLTGSYYQGQLNPAAKPSLDSIILDNCLVLGNISVAMYGAHSANQTLTEFGTRNKVSKLIVKKSTFDNSNTAFGFSNMGYDSILIKNNVVKNFSESFVSVPESGLDEKYYEPLRKIKKYVEFSDNQFENSKVVATADDRTLTPCVIKGGYGTMVFTRNQLKNLLSSNPRSDVNTMYYTCSFPGKCVFSYNTVYNVLGRGGTTNPACVLKDRGASHFVVENNKITIDKEALVKTGVLKNKNEDISKLDGNRFLCTFIQIGNQTDFTKKLVLKGNTFRVPFINMSTEIYDISDLLIENNQIEIDYFGPSGAQISTSRDGAFFLGRQRLDLLPQHTPGQFILNKNKIKINKTGGSTFNYVCFPDGVQAGSIDKPDKNFNYKNVAVKDTIEVNETLVGLSLPDGENHLYEMFLSGNNNAVLMDDATGANHLRPNAKSLQSTITIQKYKSQNNSSLFVLIPGSKQKINIQNHNGDDLNLMSYSYLTSLYNLAKEENLLCYFETEWRTKNGKTEKTAFYFYLNNTSRYISLENNVKKIIDINPAELKQKPEEIYQNSSNSQRASLAPKPLLYSGDRHLKNAELRLTNCAEVERISITLTVLKAGRDKYDPAKINKRIAEHKAFEK
jgi:hypothetical protein